MAHKLDRDMDTMNACLVPDIERIETRLRSMSSIASALPGLPNFGQLLDPYYPSITSMDEILDRPKAADPEVIAIYSGFVQDKCEQLAHDLELSSRTSAPAVPKSSQFWHSSMRKDSDTVGTKQTSNENKDEALDAIISGFSPKTVKEDIAKLVFLWVDVLEFAGFERDDVMKMW